MNINHVKAAAEAIDTNVVASVYPQAFLERWSQYAQYGADMPKSAAELDTLIEAAARISNIKDATESQYGTASSPQIAAVSEMAKRASNQVFGEGTSILNNYDLSGAAQAMQYLM